MIGRMKRWFPLMSAVLCTALAVCYLLRPDACAAVTFLPAWVWAPLGIALTLPALRAKKKTVLIAALALWMGFTLTFSEEPRSLLTSPAMSRSEFQTTRESGRGLRVVTLNCAGGSPAAASEVEAYRPDIVLLQESPGEKDVARLANELFGKDADYICSVEASIIARGKIETHQHPKHLAMVCTFARVTLRSGITAEAVSLRLTPPVFRLDLWSPSCWRDQTDNHRTRREQLKMIAQELEHVPDDIAIIAGGDFNAPAGDAVYRILRPRLRDTFRQRGTGWGNTVLNDTPVQRIDQVWISKHWQVVGVSAHKTRNSDHRLVVCDLIAPR